MTGKEKQSSPWATRAYFWGNTHLPGIPARSKGDGEFVSQFLLAVDGALLLEDSHSLTFLAYVMADKAGSRH